MPNVPVNKHVAQKFIASTPDAEVFGGALLGVIENIRADEIRPYLQKYNLESLDANRWYPEQLILDFQRAIVESRVNSTDNLVAMGMKGIDSAKLPPEVKTIEQALNALSTMFHTIHRNIPPEETLTVVESKPNFILLVENTALADDILYGYLWGIVKRYRPANASFSVTRVENPVADDYPGTAYEIVWG
ncbi:MAG: hypothetical protein ABI947_12365 [Chloroflexota bacterium]